MKTKIRWMPPIILGLLLAGILLTSTAFASVQQQAPTATPAVLLAVTSTPEPEPAIKVIIQESYIQEVMEEEFEDDPVFSQPEIDLRAPDMALISVTTRVNRFISLRPTATVQFEVEDQQILVDIVRLDVSGFNVPRSFVEKQMDELRAEIQAQLNELTGELTDADLELTKVSATEDAIILDLEPAPDAGEEGEAE